jgi:hypothetical protein
MFRPVFYIEWTIGGICYVTLLAGLQPEHGLFSTRFAGNPTPRSNRKKTDYGRDYDACDLFPIVTEPSQASTE